jgi:hypothetical protein
MGARGRVRIAGDSTIHVDEPEGEWTNTAGLILYFHRRCVEISGRCRMDATPGS